MAVTAIVQDVVRRLDDRFTADQVLRRIEIVADTDANVLRLDATDQSPRTAARLANVYAGAFIERQQTRERATASSARRRLEERYRQLSRGARRGGVGRTLRDQIERLRTLELVGTGTVSLVEEAVAPTTSNQNLLRTGLLGGLFGLLLGAGLALLRDLLRDQFDRRIRSGDDLEELLGVPLLAQIPDSRNLAHARPVDELKPAEFEGFRMLWTGLRFAADGSEMRRVMVTSSGPQEGKSLVSWYLACAAAESGGRVLLVEADARRPVLAKRHGLDDAPGILGLVERGLELEDAVTSVPVHPAGSMNGRAAGVVEVLAASTPTSSLTSLDATARLLTLLNEQTAGYDLVVVDTPPITLAAEAVPLSTGVDGVIVVSRSNRSTRDGLKQMQSLLSRLRVPVLGIVRDGGDVPAYYGESPTHASKPKKKSKSPALEA